MEEINIVSSYRNNGVSLSWAGGHFRGTRDFSSKRSSIHKLDNNYQPKFGLNLERPKKVVNQEVEAFLHNFHEDMDTDRLVDINEDVTDSEWFYFYTVSLTQSFSAGHGNNNSNILGRAFCSEAAGVSTAKQGQVDVPRLQTGMFSGSAQKEWTTQGSCKETLNLTGSSFDSGPS
ncbi:hypothetical protein M0R45_031357 [Rubus argutus]|uniref:Transcription factor MYC/MYB N-terminal domain-containing protein n=1 Tax=Rubus argutus TaxID=59490 RepID=A0AAW1WI28_RUBAR